jgi:hypothetical protein
LLVIDEFGVSVTSEAALIVVLVVPIKYGIVTTAAALVLLPVKTVYQLLLLVDHVGCSWP